MRFLTLELAILATLPAVAGEYALLTTGFRIYAERHEVRGEVVRLYADGGVIELPASAVAAFEPQHETAALADPIAPVPQAREADPKNLLRQAADRYGVPVELLESVAAAESSFDQTAVSPKGAVGIMQLMPGTAAELGADPYDLAQNVDAGARYLRDLLLKYEGGIHSALAAYNAGSGTVARYRGIPPYRETEQYVQRVVDRYQRLQSSDPGLLR